MKRKTATKSKTTTRTHKPKKSSLNAKDVEVYRQKLEQMRTDLSLIVQKKREEATPEGEVGDEADVAVRSLERDLVFEQSGNELRILEEVEAALRRIEKGTFGLCESDGEPISKARLGAMPYARYCIKCQSRFESI